MLPCNEIQYTVLQLFAETFHAHYFIELNMEMPYWCPSEGNQRKHLESTFAMKAVIFLFRARHYTLCGSRKYPYPPTDGQWKFLGGGGAKR